MPEEHRGRQIICQHGYEKSHDKRLYVDFYVKTHLFKQFYIQIKLIITILSIEKTGTGRPRSRGDDKATHEKYKISRINIIILQANDLQSNFLETNTITYIMSKHHSLSVRNLYNFCLKALRVHSIQLIRKYRIFWGNIVTFSKNKEHKF